VLELGAGSGFVGIAAGIAGASEVVLTDLEYTMPLMNANVERNRRAFTSAGCRRVTCKVLDWFHPPTTLSELGFSSVLPEEDGEDSKTTTDLPTTKSNHQYADHQLPQPQPDVLLIADCIWLEELVTPLLQTVERILQLCHDKNNNNNNRVQEEPSPVVVLISYQRRGKGAHDAFMNSLKSIFDTV